MPRIITGSCRGTQLETLAGQHTRPSGDRLKEAIFSMIQDRVYGASFLDLFAGCGQMGLEAASRGAKRSILVEKAGAAQAVITKNIQRCHLEQTCELWSCTASAALKRLLAAAEHFELIYFDPPWPILGRSLNELSPLLSQCLSPAGRLLVETECSLKPSPDLPGLKLVRSCQYGRAMVLFYALNSSEI